MAQDTNNNNDNNNNKQKQNSSNSWEIGESDFQSYHIMNPHCSVTTENHKAYKETRVCPNSKENRSRNGPRNNLMADLLDKDFKTTVLKKTKELKEYVKSRNGVPTKEKYQ